MVTRVLEHSVSKEINVTVKYQPFAAFKWPVFESGLIGPVRILKLGKEN